MKTLDPTLLAEGLLKLNTQASTEACKMMINYANILLKWNQTYNLISQNDTQSILGRHLLDSCSLWPYLHGEHILDVGTGPGLPGIPLAILSPDKQFTLLDSSLKPIQFLRQTVLELCLKNVTVIQSRVEDFHPEVKFDTIVTRAFAPIPVMLAKTQHLCAKDSCFLAMKGKYPQEEIEAMPSAYQVTAVFPLHIPFSIGERHIVKIKYLEESV